MYKKLITKRLKTHDADHRYAFISLVILNCFAVNEYNSFFETLGIIHIPVY